MRFALPCDQWVSKALQTPGLTVASLTPKIAGALNTNPTYPSGITFQQPAMFAAFLDVGGGHAGAVVGAMNTAGNAGCGPGWMPPGPSQAWSKS